MRIAFVQLVRSGPSRACMTAGRDSRVGPRNILLAGGTRPRVGPLHACNICTIRSHLPIKDMADYRTRLPRGPTAFIQFARIGTSLDMADCRMTLA
jgi:hypothetical protein